MENLRLRVTKTSSLSLNQQIKAQIRYQIINGTSARGDKLPSIRELSRLLKINRNTLTKAYKDLEIEGFIQTIPGSGTFVSDAMTISQGDTSRFLSIVKRAMEQSRKLGYSSEEFISVAQALMLKEDNPGHFNALFVECNKNALNQYIKDLKQELDIDIEGCLIEDFSKYSLSSLSRYDLIITTIGHYPALRRQYKNLDNLYGINIALYMDVIGKIMTYPYSSNIGIICVSTYGAEGLKQSLVDVGFEKDRIYASSAADMAEIKSMIGLVDVIIVSKFALAEWKQYLEEAAKPVIEYRNIVDKSSIAMLKELLADISRKRA